MSKRSEFTSALAMLLQYMLNEDDQPILDYGLRSKEEQKRLFNLKLSKCDGEIKVSKHQMGLAADIYLLDKDNPRELWNWHKGDKAIKYHDFWVESGGQPMIEWDKGHFEF